MLPNVVIVVNADNKVSHYAPFCGSKEIRASSTSNESVREAEAEFLANLTNTGYCWHVWPNTGLPNGPLLVQLYDTKCINHNIGM